MARIALFITLVLLLATCFFAFETHTKVQGLNDTVTTTKAERDTANQQRAKADADKKVAQEDAAKSKKDADDAIAAATAAKSSLEAANGQITTLNGQVTDLTNKLKIATTSTTGAPIQTGVPQETFDKVTAQLKDAQNHAAELAVNNETLKRRADDATSQVDGLKKEVARYVQHTVRNGLEGEVLAVNPGWNFVVLSIGDRQGAVSNAELILQRGNHEIGKVRITSVEPSTSVADIIPGTLARGVRVQPGDRVIFPGI